MGICSFRRRSARIDSSRTRFLTYRINQISRTGLILPCDGIIRLCHREVRYQIDIAGNSCRKTIDCITIFICPFRKGISTIIRSGDGDSRTVIKCARARKCTCAGRICLESNGIFIYSSIKYRRVISIFHYRLDLRRPSKGIGVLRIRVFCRSVSTNRRLTVLVLMALDNICRSVRITIFLYEFDCIGLCHLCINCCIRLDARCRNLLQCRRPMIEDIGELISSRFCTRSGTGIFRHCAYGYIALLQHVSTVIVVERYLILRRRILHPGSRIGCVSRYSSNSRTPYEGMTDLSRRVLADRHLIMR